jgi:hypothetical protein
MAVHTVKFTGDSSFSGTHTSGTKIYLRSDNAADDDNIILYGRKSSDSTAHYQQIVVNTNEGKIEQLGGTAWSHIYLAKWDTTLLGTASLFSEDGTAATGKATIITNPSNGETIEMGLTGFTTTFTFKTSVSTNGDVKIGSSTAETADNLASAINDSQTGTSNPTDGTDWNSTGPHAYLSATSSSSGVTLTDRIKCARQLTWVLDPYDDGDFHTCNIRGGVDGTKIIDLATGNKSASTTTASGVDLDSEDLSTTNVSGLLSGASDPVATRGRFVVDIYCQDPAASVTPVIQLSNDNTNWRNATTTITDLNTDQEQRITGDDLMSEYARINFTTWSATASKALNIKIITQS